MTGRTWGEIGLAVLIAALLLLLEHYWPWGALFRRRLHPTVNYILGTLALDLPLTGLFAVWGEWRAVVAVWLVVVVGGACVMGTYAMDNWVSTRSRADLAEGEAQILRPGGGRYGTIEERN